MTKRFVLPQGGDVIISARAAIGLISKKNGAAALLYIYILKMGGLFSEEEAEAALGMTTDELSMAAGVLAELELIALESAAAHSASTTVAPALEKPATPAEKDTPVMEPAQNPYSAEEVLDEMERKGDFFHLVSETERRLSMSRPCSVEEMKRLMWLYHDAGLPVEVLFLLLTYCVQEWDRRYGGSRRPTVRQIETEGCRWVRMGLDSQDAASKYIRRRKRMLSDLGQAAQLLGLGGRDLAPSEEKYLTSWLDWGFKPAEIQEAYDRTMLNTGSLSWKYMNTIIKRWNDQGLRSLRDIRDKDVPGGSANRTPSGNNSGHAAAGNGTSGIDPLKERSLNWVRERIKQKEAEKK